MESDDSMRECVCAENAIPVLRRTSGSVLRWRATAQGLPFEIIRSSTSPAWDVAFRTQLRVLGL